jgi:hypothetical protein
LDTELSYLYAPSPRIAYPPRYVTSRKCSTISHNGDNALSRKEIAANVALVKAAGLKFN